MRTEPKSEAEIQSMMLMPEGIYPFTVVEAKERVSKSGNEMIELKLEVIDGYNRPHFIFDYLLASMAFKLRHFCEYTGLLDKYDADNLQASDCVRKRGFVELKADKGPRVVDGREYAPKNSVKDYVADKPAEADKLSFAEATLPPDFNQEIPW